MNPTDAELDFNPKVVSQYGQTTEERFWAKVDKTGACWNWIATKQPDGYGMFYLKPKMVKAHRVSYTWTHGNIPKGMFIDHMCHNHSCVNPAHLRAVTRKQNSENRKGGNANNTSGYRGVFWNENYGMWTVEVVHNAKRHYLGKFSDVEEANAAAVAKRNELYTHNDFDRAQQPAEASK